MKEDEIERESPLLMQKQLSGDQNQIILMLGKKGRGKTRLIQSLFLPSLRRARLVIFDPHREYLQPWITRAESLEDLQTFLTEHDEDSYFSVVWTPADTTELPYFISLIYQMRRIWAIIEECNMRGVGNIREPSPEFIDLVNFGRNRKISLICTAKRPAQVVRDLTAQADIIISFRQDEPNDIAYIREFCGKGVDNLVTELGEHDWEIIYPVKK